MTIITKGARPLRDLCVIDHTDLFPAHKNTDAMTIKQIYTGCLAHAAYCLESNGEAAIFDPLRETQPYIDRASADGAKIKYVFSWASLFTLRGFILMVVGGFLVGFGTRYAGGCTSGHAIMGLSDLQWPSLIATIMFMVGGVITTWFILPHLLAL